MEYVCPLARFYQWEATKPNEIFLQQPVNDKWMRWTWQQAGNEIRRMAAALKDMDLPAGSHIALVSKNCAHWILCDLAIMMAGHVSVPLYPNLHAETVKQILEHSEASVLFVGKLDDWHAMKPGVPPGVRCISFPIYPHAEYENWEEIIKQYEPVRGTPQRAASELATIIYTSGTTGTPKGVMHSFNNISFTLVNALPPLGLNASSTFFSYLPLSHIAERLLVEMGSIYTGGQISFTESLEKFPKNLREVQPTVFFAVHRIWKKFQQGILEKIPQKKLTMLLRIPILSAIIKRKIRKQLGLSKAKAVFTGASPTPASLIEWFETLGIRIQEAYGLTENCIYSNVTLHHRIRPGWVGQKLPHCEVKLSSEREVLIKHKALMMGYYKEPEMSAAAFTDDGFLKTGDEGEIDVDGFLKITGRLKELFKTSKGKYVAPSPIEMKLAGGGDIEWVCVIGSGLPQPMALVVLSATGKTKAKDALHHTMQQLMHEVNSSLDASERLAKLILLQDEWSVENGMLTPSLKIKRNMVERKYTHRYDEWWLGQGVLIWED
jgi:long-chain acyl-CoA synthetase